MGTYHQLTQGQRYQIYVLKKMGHFVSEIAEVMGVDKSTVGRELKRNSGKRGYRPQQAQALALERRYKGQCRISARTWVTVSRLLGQEWSPEQISGRLKKEQGLSISHEWIYQYVLKNKWSGGELYRHLRCQKQRRKRYGKYERRGQLQNCTSIEERPALVNRRKRLGDWEVDTLIGKRHKQAMVTLTERRSRFTLLGKVTHRTAQAVENQIHKLLLPVAYRVYTLTSDHGKEFANHQHLAKTLNLKFYFAHPYAAWERGTNENTNGLIRQYFPKKHDFQEVTRKDIQQVMHRLNFRPRKTLLTKHPSKCSFICLLHLLVEFTYQKGDD